MKGIYYFSAALSAGIISGPVWGASVTFNFASPSIIPNVGSSFTFSDAGSGLSVTARGYEGMTPNWMTRSVVGLGVMSAPLLQPLSTMPNHWQVDGIGGNESIQLSFSKQVVLDSLTFNLVDSDDNVVLSVMDPAQGIIYDNFLDPSPVSTTGSLQTLTLDLQGLQNRSGLLFSLRAKDPSDNFSVAGVTANFYKPPSSAGPGGGPVTVPLPASAWAGLGLFGAAVVAPAIKKRIRGK